MKVLYFMLAVLGLVSLGFLGAYFYAWHMNAVAGAKYDLNSLVSVGQLIGAQTTGLVVNHSLFNTKIPWLDDFAGAMAARWGKKEGEQ